MKMTAEGTKGIRQLNLDKKMYQQDAPCHEQGQRELTTASISRNNDLLTLLAGYRDKL
jgi:hypothetical protein